MGRKKKAIMQRKNWGFRFSIQIFFNLLNFFADVTISPLKLNNEKDIEEILDFDKTLSNHNRSAFLKYLFSQTTVYIARHQNDEGAVIIAGYIVSSKADHRVLALYADNQRIADALLGHQMTQSRAKKVRNQTEHKNCKRTTIFFVKVHIKKWFSLNFYDYFIDICPNFRPFSVHLVLSGVD